MISKEKGFAIIAGIKSGLISSSCCIIPIILVAFGFVSVSTAIAISQYKIYFLGAGIAALVVSLFFFYGKIKKQCGACSLNKKSFIGTAVALHVIAYIMLLYILSPFVAPAVYARSDVSKTGINPSETLFVKIKGMSCPGCAEGIKYQLEDTYGVFNAEIDYMEGRGVIRYDPSKITPEEILKSKAFETYPADIIERED